MQSALLEYSFLCSCLPFLLQVGQKVHSRILRLRQKSKKMKTEAEFGDRRRIEGGIPEAESGEMFEGPFRRERGREFR